MNKTILFFLLVNLLVFSCQRANDRSSTKKTNSSNKNICKLETSHANLFDIYYVDEMKVIVLKNPDDTSQILIKYFLGADKGKFEEGKYDGIFIKIPLNNVTITSSTQAAYLNSLGVIEKIKGISEPNYFSNKKIKERFEKGLIKDIGPSANIDYEVLINLNTDVFFISLFKNSASQKINELGLQPCLDLAYLENTPLGRAEWIKFFALFFNKEDLADSVFREIEKEYFEVRDLANDIKDRPTIISGKKYGQLWHVPGGESYMAKFFKDAGADYLWKDDKSTASIPLDFESVYSKGADADYWCFKQLSQTGYSLEELSSEFAPYKDFESYKNNQIIFCNVSDKPYYEDGVMEPHLILSDLVKLIHPKLLPNYETKYFEFLKSNE